MHFSRFSGRTKKILFFVILPVFATFIMSLGIYVSRMSISGWVRIYGFSTAKSGSRGGYRLTVRKKKLNEVVSPVKAKVFLEYKDEDMLLGKAENVKGDEALSVNVIYPKLPAGTYKLRWETDSEIGKEVVYTNIKLTDSPGELSKYYEDVDGEDTNGNYASLLTSISKPDSYGNIIALHPVNSRGLKTFFKDIVYLRAHTKDGKPLRIKASIKVVRGILRFPKTADCNPPIIKRRIDKCMVEIRDGQKIPFELKTDQLGLASMTLYPISHGASFEITYTVKNENGEWGRQNTIQFDLGSVEDDVFIGFFPRILRPGITIAVPLRAIGKSLLYVDVFNSKQWINAGIARLANSLGVYRLNTEGLKGRYKLEGSLSYIPISNSIINTTFWVSDNLKDPSVLSESLDLALKNNRIDEYFKNYLNWLKKHGELWKAGYDFDEDVFFFTGLLDNFHYSPKILRDSKRKKETNLSTMKRKGQTLILSTIAVSGIILVMTIIFAVFLLIKERQTSQADMSKIMADSDGEELFWKNLKNTPDEKDARYWLIGFGILIAGLVAFIVVAIIWLMFNIKWNM